MRRGQSVGRDAAPYGFTFPGSALIPKVSQCARRASGCLDRERTDSPRSASIRHQRQIGPPRPQWRSSFSFANPLSSDRAPAPHGRRGGPKLQQLAGAGDVRKVSVTSFGAGASAPRPRERPMTSRSARVRWAVEFHEPRVVSRAAALRAPCRSSSFGRHPAPIGLTARGWDDGAHRL